MEDLALYLKMEAGKIKAEQVLQEKKLHIQTEKVKKEWSAIALPCPNCKAPLFLKHICKKKGPENIHGYTCLWYCEKGDCVYEKYTYENATEEIKKLKERRIKNGII
ncbi:hypothetical protein LCGC14_1998710, partial [marine sediment metagenome]